MNETPTTRGPDGHKGRMASEKEGPTHTPTTTPTARPTPVPSAACPAPTADWIRVSTRYFPAAADWGGVTITQTERPEQAGGCC